MVQHFILRKKPISHAFMLMHRPLYNPFTKKLLNNINKFHLVRSKHQISTTTESAQTLGFNNAIFLPDNSNNNSYTSYDFVNFIRSCNYTHGQQLHCYILLSGFSSDVSISTALISFYVKFDVMNDAHKVFDEITEPNVVSWNSLISGYTRSGMFSKGLDLFLKLERSDVCCDSFSLSSALAACGHLSLLHLGKSVHAKVVKSGVECSIVIANCLIDMYGKCRSVNDAIWVFNSMDYKDIVSWNTIIAASARNRRLEQAFDYFYSMPNPDTISYNALINGIAQFGNIEDAREILSTMPNSNLSSWNSIVTGYVNRHRQQEALEFFNKMHSHGVGMDQFTVSSILSGIASIGALVWGLVIQCCAIKYGLDNSVVVGSALIDMYSKCGLVKTAEFVFGQLPNKNLVTWNAMISGYAHNGNSIEVIKLFEQLKTEKYIKPDEITFVNVLSACWHNKMPLEVTNKYFESMTNDYGIEVTAEHCSCLVKVMVQENEAWRAVKTIDELGFVSCAMVWKALLGACASSGDIEVAEIAAAKVTELEGNNEFVYVIVSNILARSGKWADVGEIRKLMKEKRVEKEIGNSWIEVENFT